MGGEYARWLSVLLFFEFILHPGKDAMIVLGLQGSLLLFEIISLVFKLAAIFIGFYYFKDELTAIILFSITGAFISLLFILWLFFKSEVSNGTPRTSY